MKKIMKFIPLFLFLSILLWGFVNINIQNTAIFNNDYIDSDPSINSEELSKTTGIDLSTFNEDRSMIKMYSENNTLKVVINERYINLDELVIGKVILLIVDSIDNTLMYFNNLINNVVQRGI